MYKLRFLIEFLIDCWSVQGEKKSGLFYPNHESHKEALKKVLGLILNTWRIDRYTFLKIAVFVFMKMISNQWFQKEVYSAKIYSASINTTYTHLFP